MRGGAAAREEPRISLRSMRVHEGYLIRPPDCGKSAPTNRNHAMSQPSLTGDRKLAWQNVLTVVSAAILIGAEVFGAAFAGGWAVATQLELGEYGVHILQGIFFIAGIAVMVAFLRSARRVEPFTTRG